VPRAGSAGPAGSDALAADHDIVADQGEVVDVGPRADQPADVADSQPARRSRNGGPAMPCRGP